MDFQDVVRRRRMVRSFDRRPVPAAVLDRILDNARRAPSAGHSQGWSFVVLEGPEETARYWDATLPAAARTTFRWPGLLDAPVLVVALSHPGSYLARYREPDKHGSGLGAGVDRWPVPYWHVDTGFAVLLMLLTAVDAGLGASFFGVFARREQLLAALGVPPGYEPVGTVALGYRADEGGANRSGSASRGRRAMEEVVHRGRW